MATISALTENFTGGQPGDNISTSNTVFDSLAGTGTSKFNADTYITSQPSAEFVATGAYRTGAMNHSAALGWRCFALKVITRPGSNTAIASWWNGATVAGDLRLNTGGTLTLRDASYSARYAASTVLTNDTWYWIAIRVNTYNVNGGHRLKIYQNGSLLEDSDDLTNSGFSQTQTDIFRMGIVANVTSTVRFARVRADDSTEVDSGITPANPVATYTLQGRTLVDTAGSTGTMTLTQTSGPTAEAVTGPTDGVFTVVHPAPFNSAMHFDLVATDGGETDTVDVTISPSGAKQTRFIWNGTAWV